MVETSNFGYEFYSPLRYLFKPDAVLLDAYGSLDEESQESCSSRSIQLDNQTYYQSNSGNSGNNSSSNGSDEDVDAVDAIARGIYGIRISAESIEGFNRSRRKQQQENYGNCSLSSDSSDSENQDEKDYFIVGSGNWGDIISDDNMMYSTSSLMESDEYF
jgi:hypothetical protein